MSVHDLIPARFHQQDGTFLCGAACAQMVLESVGAGLLDQDALNTEIQNLNATETGWAAAPDGLQGAMSLWQPVSFPGSISLAEVDCKDALSRKVVWSIHQHRLPAVVLTSGMSHWIVVRGFEASAAPAAAHDSSYTITSLDIHNPSPLVDAPPPPPHDAADLCGSGGDRGFADENVAYSHWLSAFLFPVAASSHWAGKYLAVCDSDPPPICPGPQAVPRKREKGDRLLTPDEARAAAKAGISQYGLDKREGWSASLRNTKPGKPILVQRIDKLDSYYYMVPMQTEKAVPVLVNVDGRFGNYQQAARTAKTQANALARLNFDPQWAEKVLLGQKIDLGRRGRLTVRKEAFSLYPTLVWKPCRESMSPYIPFFMATVGNRRIYLRVDGRVFTKLHTRDRGN